MIERLETQIRYYPAIHIDIHRTHDNLLMETATYSGEPYHKTIVAITTQIGCPAKCDFCLVGESGFKRNADPDEQLQQVRAVIENPTGIPWLDPKKPVKVSLCRAGEPLLNPYMSEALEEIARAYNPSFQAASIMPDRPTTHKILSEMAAFVREYNNSFQMMVSLHTTDENKRKNMINYRNLMSFQQIKEFGEWWVNETRYKRKVNLHFAMMEDNEIDLAKIREIFNPRYFAIRLGFYMPTTRHNAALHPAPKLQKLKDKSREAQELGYTCIESIARDIEHAWDCRANCGFKLFRESYMPPKND